MATAIRHYSVYSMVVKCRMISGHAIQTLTGKQNELLYNETLINIYKINQQIPHAQRQI